MPYPDTFADYAEPPVSLDEYADPTFVRLSAALVSFGLTTGIRLRRQDRQARGWRYRIGTALTGWSVLSGILVVLILFGAKHDMEELRTQQARDRQ